MATSQQFDLNASCEMRGPESTFRIPYKVVIRVQQLVPFAQASIG